MGCPTHTSRCSVPAAAGRVVMAHLGPLDGLPMGTRCGATDPGAVLYLL